MTHQAHPRGRFTAVALLALAFAAASPQALPADALSKDEVDAIVQPAIDGAWCAGLVVGLIDENGRRVYGYGRGAGVGGGAAADAPPDGDTVYEIGSVTKAFTGLLLAEMAGRGEVGLDDPLQKYLPDGVKAPQVGDDPITLAHLASHTSGLPRMPGNFAPKDANNPYADYTPEQMYAFLATCEPARKPGEKSEYSNLGMGLLGHVLALRAGKDYEALLTERVLGPLGMTDTRIALDDASRACLAGGHDADGDPAPNWDLPTFAGAGALRSTTNDMLKFIAANLGLAPAPVPLAEAIAASHAPRGPAGGESGVGLGWQVRRKPVVLWHNGQTGGYHSFCGFVPDRRVGVVVLSNTATGVVDALGNALLKRMAGVRAEPVVLRKATPVPADVLEQRVGKYVLTPFFAITVTRDGDQLHCQATNQPRFKIYPESETEFFYKVVDAQVTFKLDRNGRAFMLVLNQNGMKLPGLRVDAPAAGPPAGDAPPDARAPAAADAPAESEAGPRGDGGR
jgi:CubicO group peptidase (beta-lactamase class C family)